MIKKALFITGLILFAGVLPAFSLELDMSVDDEIKRKYDSSKLEYDVLPNLPKVSPSNSQTSVPKTTPVYSTTTKPPTITKIDRSDAIKIPNRTKFQVKSNQTISNWLKAGSTVSFKTTAPVFKKGGVSIPAGTTIFGTVTDSHLPQKTGNGGLVVIKVTGLSYNGKTYAATGKVTKANAKKIFFNNIKGKRQYLAGVGKQIDKGEAFNRKTKNTANKMSDNPILVILSPIPVVVGYAGYAVCTVLSPITGLNNKGGNISIPAGSSFELKLQDEAFVY